MTKVSTFLLKFVDPYELYLQDHVKHVTYLTELKYKLRTEAAFDKAAKKQVTLDTKMWAVPESSSGLSFDDVRNKRNRPVTRIAPACGNMIFYKKKVKTEPPAPKPEIVAAKKAVKSAKVIAKAEKLGLLAEKITEKQKVRSSRVRSDLTYAQAVVAKRSENAPAAAQNAAATIHARSYLRQERVESKRVPLYERRGGNAAMPEQPSGGFLVQRDGSTRTRVQRVSTKSGEDVSTVITETFTKD
jgi:L-ribulose-5-phosphate 3-epimerase UlaE